VSAKRGRASKLLANKRSEEHRGDTRSLILHPASTRRQLTDEQRLASGRDQT
jgi:O-acetylhomoserine/O-acetylserine sulfhydrylase-like pyridoxal-dependent enzyme